MTAKWWRRRPARGDVFFDRRVVCPSITRSSRTDGSSSGGASLVKHVERWAKVRGDKLAYRFLDFSTERDGVARELTWADFSARNRGSARRLQQVTQPGDRVAILCPQNLDYLVAFRHRCTRSHRGAAVRPVRTGSRGSPARRARRLPAVGDPDHHRGRRGCRKFFRSRPAKGTPRSSPSTRFPTRSARPGRCHDTVEDTIAYLQYTSGSTRVPTVCRSPI